jgi:hypothetical protein
MMLQEIINVGVPALGARGAGQILKQIKTEIPPAKLIKQSDRTLLVLAKAYSGSNVFNISLRSPDDFAKFASKRLCRFYYVFDIMSIHDRLEKGDEP